MILDSLLEFADAVALSTAGTGRALVGDVVDLGAPPSGTVFRDIGNGKQLYLVISVDTAVTSAGAATVSFELSSDAQAAIAVDASETIHFATVAIPKATLVAGYQLVIPIPWESPLYERYLGIVQNVGVAALTAGKINAFITANPASWKAYTDGV